MNFFKMLALIGLISSWMKKALEDGKITLEEALNLIVLIAKELNLSLAFAVSDVLGKPPDEAAEPLDEGAAVEPTKPKPIIQ